MRQLAHFAPLPTDQLPLAWAGQHLPDQSELSYMRRVMYSKTQRYRLDELIKEMKMGSNEIPESCSGRPIQNPGLELCKLLAEVEEKQRNRLQNDLKPAGNVTNLGNEDFLPEFDLGSQVQPSLKGEKNHEIYNKQNEATKAEKRWVGPDAERHFAESEKGLQAILERQNAKVVSTEGGDKKPSRLMPLPEPLSLLNYNSELSSMLANFDINLLEHLRKSNPIK